MTQLRAQGLQDRDILSYSTTTGETVNAGGVLQRTVKLLNATKPGADLHQLAKLLRSSQHTPSHITPQCRPHYSSKTAPPTPMTPVTKATPSSQYATSYSAQPPAMLSATRGLHSARRIITPQGPQAKRHITNTQQNTQTPTENGPRPFNLCSVTGSAGTHTHAHTYYT